MNGNAKNSIKALQTRLPHDNILLCQVYGSHVWGTARPDSDLDVFIITKKYSNQLTWNMRDVITGISNGVKEVDIWQLQVDSAQKYCGLYGSREYVALHYGMTLYKSAELTSILAEHTLEWCVKEWLRWAKLNIPTKGNRAYLARHAIEYSIKACLLHMGIRFDYRCVRDLPRLCAPIPFELPFDPYEIKPVRELVDVDDVSLVCQAREMIRLSERFVAQGQIKNIPQ